MRGLGVSKLKSRKLLFGIGWACLLNHPLAFAQEAPLSVLLKNTEIQFAAFQEDSDRFMNSIPLKKGAKPHVAFSSEEIQGNDFVILKDKYRIEKNLVAYEPKDSNPFVRVKPFMFSGHDDTWAATSLLGIHYLNTLSQMDASLKKGQVRVAPWSDHYWPTYKGHLGMRYADDQFPGSENWKENFDFASKVFKAVLKKFARGKLDQEDIKKMSPAEKYDLLIGNRSMEESLTGAGWKEGEQYYRDSKKVETWMGLCHGWAPASYMMPRPRHAVKTFASDNKTELMFYPSDIKALATLLWSNASPNALILGGRCNDKNPKRDPSGRTISEDCFDINPGSWHSVIVNLVGKQKRSFVMDATFDYEVWNQPIYSYQYVYFNPATGKASENLSEATVEAGKFSDKFKKFRSPETKNIVGISMEVTYVGETEPSSSLTDTESNDARVTVQYMYDIELDASGNIIGGEWYQNIHPDFLWNPAEDAKAETAWDSRLHATWDAKLRKVPEEYERAASEMSQSHIPLAKIVDALVSAAQNRGNGF